MSTIALPVIRPIVGRRPRDPRMTSGVELLERYRTSDGDYIDAGFEWDGATIPRLVWSIVGSPYDPEILIPSLEHDYDYWTRRFTRKLCDDRFYSNMIRCGVHKSRAATMYKAVRTFGGAYFNREDADRNYAIDLYNYITDMNHRRFLNPPEVSFLKYFSELGLKEV